VVKGEAMRKTSEILQNQLDYIEKNVAWKWQAERLQSELATFKNVLIEAGILVNAKGINQTIIVVDGEQYSIRKVK
jgi:hypothetical protein